MTKIFSENNKKEIQDIFKKMIDLAMKFYNDRNSTFKDDIEDIQNFFESYEWKLYTGLQTLQKDEYKGFALYKEIEEEEYIKFKKGRSAWHGIYIWFGVSRDDIYMRIVTKEEEKCNALLKIQKDNILDYKLEEKIDKFEEIKDRLFDVFLYLSNYINNLSKDDFKIIKDYNMMKNNTPLNQILYGSPGTGKTYHTIDKALEILGENLESRDEKKAKFDEYVKNGQIVFTTFHQSYGYEEFVEGIKPRIDSKENSKEIEYEIKDGIFKELCEKALDNYENSILNADELNKKIELKEKVENFLNWLLETNEPIGKTKGGNFFVVEIDNKTIVIYSEGVERFDGIFNLNLSIFMELLRCKDEFNNATEMFKKVFNRDYADRTHTYYFNLVKKFKAYEEKQLTAKIENNKNNDNSLKPYIIIIDEINRGNLSKIFGELITLIEPSKRIGEKEELKVTLPYSGEKFGVPKNVYIIGTMNTADRSITSLDTALRRRFEFIEMMPDVSKLSIDCEGINLQELLKAINTRIEYLLDREKTIGHAFFISVENLESLKKVFKNRIIPLLQEYFYNDYALIDAVLNKNGMLEISVENKDYLKNMTEFIESDKIVYKFSDSNNWNKDTFIKIYK
ncbi:McrB family protein [Campylobacter jejuni]|uniref:McrB family protein n=1 Tax=Campylobacter jejuni TaxID=197 RepID=UPI000C28FA70|nr:AAA family ATPase [Campylobacter jejuni]MDM3529310.1 AAA family ATPase [Campylobacter jejuni]PJP20390.1 AAA family ATPase [Campylobacter jejuni subsp. jejuni]PJP21097.1 AAA family ATPase [Campylobacter jejuni subsp. jejuni]PJP23215.1 AAA family ATPase [Campylobacter jejuni subsp. jejuni]PKD34664.1 AAA family ATPase [Campylobacter jejuni subsp. jejuni]